MVVALSCKESEEVEALDDGVVKQDGVERAYGRGKLIKRHFVYISTVPQ